MEATNPAGQFLDEEFPVQIRNQIPFALRRAYAAVDETIVSNQFLCTPGGKYQRGDLIALAAEYEFERLIERNRLPFDASWEYFARPTGKHLVMRSRRSRITISQVEDLNKKPRRALFRNKYSIPNAPYLFESMNQEFRDDCDLRLIHILHGYQTLNFAHLTIPSPEKNEHVYSTFNLMNMPHAVPSDLPPPEGPSESPEPEALENLMRRIKDDE